jgi:DNA polymerase III subunit gamma/tau
MAYLVVARKWRPQNFEDVAGQGHITRTLQNAIRAERIAHAYLFSGVRGVGKTTAARILAKALNCDKGPTATPCNNCSVCQEITNGNCIDVLEIDGASNRGIDEVRQIIENVRYQPAKCRYKIYIIDEVHQVTKDAFNALLKTLEEPPPSVKFILATTEPNRLPETILSRCQRYDFRRIALRDIVERLREIAREENLTITDGALVLLGREADGSMRDAQSLLEQVLASSGLVSSVDEQSLQELLGLAERRALYEISAAAIQGDAARVLELIGRLAAEGRDLCRLSRDLVEHFRNLMVARLAAEAGASSNRALLLDLPDQEIDDLSAQSKNLSVETLVDYYDFMAAGDDDVARSPNPRFALEAVLVKLALLPNSLPVQGLLERLEKLERSLAAAPASQMNAVNEAGPVSKGAQSLGMPKARESAATVVAAPALQAASKAVDRESMWREFVTAVRQEKKFIASHLDGARLLHWSSGQLSIGVNERHDLSFLQDGDNLAALKAIARRFFAEEVSITIKSVDGGTSAAIAADNASTPSGADKLSEMVHEALRVFPGASVRSVRRDS